MNRLVSVAVSGESSNEEVFLLVGLATVVSAPKVIGKHEGKRYKLKIKILTSPPRLLNCDYTKGNAVSRR